MPKGIKRFNKRSRRTHEGAPVVAQKWIKANDRRKVKERAPKTVKSADDEEETNAIADERGLCNVVDFERLVW